MSTPQQRKPLLQTLPLQIEEQIALSIVKGIYPPGSRLREIELAEFFNVSRSTIREALRLLEKRNLIQIKPQRGAHVTQLSAKELEDLFEVRASLLATGSSLAAANYSAAQGKVLTLHLSKLRENVDDLDSYAASSEALVNTIMELSHNTILASYINDFAHRICRYVRLGLTLKSRRKNSLAIWVRLISAIKNGNGEEAGKLHRTLALNNRTAALEEFIRVESKD